VSLREQAAADLLMIHEDTVDGFGWPLVITNPAGDTIEVNGLSTDIARAIDPETQQAVTGRFVSVSIPLKSLRDNGFDLPRNVADRGARPWLVRVNDIEGMEHTFKVIEASPDRALGCVNCLLEVYKTQTDS
jgi:hypothetical protein